MKVIIKIEGGQVNEVLCDSKGVVVEIRDYDIQEEGDGKDEDGEYGVFLWEFSDE